MEGFELVMFQGSVPKGWGTNWSDLWLVLGALRLAGVAQKDRMRGESKCTSLVDLLRSKIGESAEHTSMRAL